MVLTSLSFSQFECDLCSKDFKSAQGAQTSSCDQQSQRTQGTAKNYLPSLYALFSSVEHKS